MKFNDKSGMSLALKMNGKEYMKRKLRVCIAQSQQQIQKKQDESFQGAQATKTLSKKDLKGAARRIIDKNDKAKNMNRKIAIGNNNNKQNKPNNNKNSKKNKFSGKKDNNKRKAGSEKKNGNNNNKKAKK